MTGLEQVLPVGGTTSVENGFRPKTDVDQGDLIQIGFRVETRLVRQTRFIYV